MANIVPFGGFSGLGPFGRLGHMGLTSSFGMSDLLRTMLGDSLSGTFRVDIHDEGDRYEIEADLPGLHREMINVTAQDGMLTISADMDQETETEKDDYVVHERRRGTVSRSFSISDVREDEITASYTDGVLKVILPKGSDDDLKKRTVPID